MITPALRHGGVETVRAAWFRSEDHLALTVTAIGWVALVILWQSAPAIEGWAAGRPALMAVMIGLLALLMTMAMMVPTVMPTIRYVALSGLPRRRLRGPLWFVAGYLSVWTFVAVGLMVAVASLTAVAGATLALAALAVAAVVLQRSRYKRRTLGRCRRTASISISGPGADVDCLVFGTRIALDCVTACIGLMSVAIASGHSLLVMGAIGAVMLHERAVPIFQPLLGIAIIGLVTGSALLSSALAGSSEALAGPGSIGPLAPWICLIP